MHLRLAIFLSALVHLALMVGFELALSEWSAAECEVAVSSGAPVVIQAYSPPAESLREGLLVEPVEVVEVSLEALPELALETAPLGHPENLHPDQVAEIRKVAAPANPEHAALHAEPPKIPGRDDLTAAPLPRKVALVDPAQTPPRIDAPRWPQRAPSLPPRSSTTAIALPERTPFPFASNAPSGASVDAMPRKLRSNAAPFYPREALAAGVQGRVRLRVTIEKDGSVGPMSVDTSSGSPSLDDAAMAAVRSWRFEPARRGGEAVAYDVIVPVEFAIRRS